MPAPQKIIDLVNRFKEQKDDYKSVKYNETQVRRDFIDPFFKALGWDIDNEQDYAESYREVIHEDAIKIGKTTKAPDYSFRIGGQRKFFVEAKKPSVNIYQDMTAALQVRRYGWNAKLALSIITDFEEFAVYDTQIKPKTNDKASNARIKYYTFEEYIDKWDEIAGIFSKEAILKGSFDRYVKKGKKTGTAEVDDEFLKDIEKWREQLATNIAAKNVLNQRELNFAVQTILDRIIFLRICEDRGVEQEGRLKQAVQGKNIYDRLIRIFKEADDKYNSGLFHFKKEEGRAGNVDTITPALEISNKVLQDIVNDLYYPKSPYEFSVISADILGQVYEQFLGKQITLTSTHRISVEEKPEVKKAGGVFYTPEYIVNYIVENTVGKLLESSNSPNKVEKLTIIDPACGSGSFLIVAYQKLLDWHLDYYVKHIKTYKKHLVEIGDNKWRLSIAERKRILLNNIYGVDLDSQAVEVTKLSLLLKVLEGESRETIEKQLTLFNKRALPDLSNNIKCGNSLIGSDFYNQPNLDLTEEDHYRINCFDWEKEFKDIMTNGGFDAVIGNPPYIRIQKMRDYASKEVDFYGDNYKSTQHGNYDIYVIFIEKALSIMNKSGLTGYILPHRFFNSEYGEPVRKLISEGKHLSKVIDFREHQIFDTATTYTCLLFLTANINNKFETLKVKDFDNWQNQILITRPHKDYTSTNEWYFVSSDIEKALFNKLMKMPLNLGKITDNVFQGLITGADPVYNLILTQENEHTYTVFSKALDKELIIEKKITKPLLKGADIHTYNIDYPEHVILFPYSTNPNSITLYNENELQQNYPLCWNYLQSCKNKLICRDKNTWDIPLWWQFSRNQNISKMDKPKIMGQVLAKNASFTYDSNGSYCFVGGGNAGGYGVLLDTKSKLSELYVLGLINSKLLDFFLKIISSIFSGGYYSYAKRYLEKLPIPKLNMSNKEDKQNHDKMVELVEWMLDLNERLQDAKAPQEITMLERQIEATDRQIDNLVYKLYDLTDEEIKIVEESA